MIDTLHTIKNTMLQNKKLSFSNLKNKDLLENCFDVY